MKRHLLIVAVAVLVASAGCRRHQNTSLVPPAAGRPEWSLSDATIVEGNRVTVTLTLSRAPAHDVEVALIVSSAAEVDAPGSVVFPAGTASRSVTLTGIPMDAAADRTPTVTARTASGNDVLTLHVLEDDVTAGSSWGPVAYSAGTALLTGPGADGIWTTGDEELIVAQGVGVVPPVLSKVKVGFLGANDLSLPVVTGVSDAVLVLGSVTTTTKLFQVQGIAGTPAITGSLTIPGLPGNVSRPVMIGGTAVLVSRGADAISPLDDTLQIVRGIGTTTLTVTGVSLPGLAAGAPSIPMQSSATSCLVVTSGADGNFGTGDEVLVYVTGLDAGAVTLTPLFAGRIRGDAMGQPIPTGGSSAGVLTAGADATFGTADDTLQVVRGLGGILIPALPFVVGAIASDAAWSPAATGSDAVLIPRLSGDVALVTSLSADPMVLTPLAAAFPVAGSRGRIINLSVNAAVRLTAGPDGAAGTADDGVVLLTGLAGTAASTTAAAPFASSIPFVSSTTSVALAGTGPDSVAGTSDDQTLSVGGIGGSVATSSASTGAFAPLGEPALVPTGAGSSLCGRTAGPDGVAGNADDMLTVTVVP